MRIFKVRIIKIAFIFFASVFILLTGCKKVDDTYSNAIFSANIYNGTIFDFLKSQPPGRFDSLLSLVNRVDGFSDFLKSRSITFFAPVNENFRLFINNLNLERKASIPEKISLYLSSINRFDLDTALNKYLFKGIITTDSLKNLAFGSLFETVKFSTSLNMEFYYTNASGVLSGGPSAIILSDTHQSKAKKEWDKTQTDIVDIIANNGVIHIIGSGEVFGFGNYLVKTINKNQ